VKACGWTQSDFGILVALSHPEVGLVETGRRNLSPEARPWAIRALGLTAGEVREVSELSPFDLAGERSRS
jgi:hypothetical protein